MAWGAPISLQRTFWNRWNATNREESVGEVSRRQAEVMCGWLDSLGRRDLDIADVGCGTGWLCRQLTRFGQVTGTDLSDEVLARAQHRAPEVKFVAGDFMTLDFGVSSFDVVVTLEVLSHVSDQKAFVAKLAHHLRPSGHLMMATQNRVVLQHFNRLFPPAPGQLRRWVDRRELRALLTPEFEVLELFSVTPMANRGVMRLVNSRMLNRPVRAMVGDRVEKLKEAVGLGWTLMALARRRGSA
jgi:2-polyprenyl-3-methyl-5-hydroxy-6-metoxy-1,4-benzoquinol methylase